MKHINGQTLGRELTRKCGEEEQWPKLDAPGKTTLRFLRYAISYVPSALKVGADLNNTSFIFNQPGREFVITSGDGDWEFYFYQDEKENIIGEKIRQPPLWTEFKRFGRFLLLLLQHKSTTYKAIRLLLTIRHLHYLQNSTKYDTYTTYNTILPYTTILDILALAGFFPQFVLSFAPMAYVQLYL